MASAGWEFKSVFTYNGSSYTDVTLESQSPAGTAFAILGGTSHFLYLGHTERFDMAIFDIATAGSLGALKWEYTDGDGGWSEFVPASGRFELDPDDDQSMIAYRESDVILSWNTKNNGNNGNMTFLQCTSRAIR